MPNLIDQLSGIAARRCAVDDDERQLIHVAFLAGWSYQQEDDAYMESVLGPKETWRWRRDR